MVGPGLDLERPGVGIAVQDLALQVAALDAVVVDQRQVADAGGGEIQRGRRAEPARADQQDTAGAQPSLPVLADLGQRQLARIPFPVEIATACAAVSSANLRVASARARRATDRTSS